MSGKSKDAGAGTGASVRDRCREKRKRRRNGIYSKGGNKRARRGRGRDGLVLGLSLSKRRPSPQLRGMDDEKMQSTVWVRAGGMPRQTQSVYEVIKPSRKILSVLLKLMFSSCFLNNKRRTNAAADPYPRIGIDDR
jgi:hypothetical protein